MRIFATHLKRERRPRHLDMNSVYNWASNAKMNVVVHISRDALQYFGETDRQTCVLNFPLQPISRYMPDIAQSDSSGECKSNWPVAFLVRNTLSKILPSSANLYVNRRKFVTLDMVDTCMKLVESCFEAVRERDGHTIQHVVPISDAVHRKVYVSSTVVETDVIHFPGEWITLIDTLDPSPTVGDTSASTTMSSVAVELNHVKHVCLRTVARMFTSTYHYISNHAMKPFWKKLLDDYVCVLFVSANDISAAGTRPGNDALKYVDIHICIGDNVSDLPITLEQVVQDDSPCSNAITSSIDGKPRAIDKQDAATCTHDCVTRIGLKRSSQLFNKMIKQMAYSMNGKMILTDEYFKDIIPVADDKHDVEMDNISIVRCDNPHCGAICFIEGIQANYVNVGMCKAIRKEIARAIATNNAQRLIYTRKLALVLDIDETLVKTKRHYRVNHIPTVDKTHVSRYIIQDEDLCRHDHVHPRESDTSGWLDSLHFRSRHGEKHLLEAAAKRHAKCAQDEQSQLVSPSKIPRLTKQIAGKPLDYDVTFPIITIDGEYTSSTATNTNSVPAQSAASEFSCEMIPMSFSESSESATSLSHPGIEPIQEEECDTVLYIREHALPFIVKMRNHFDISFVSLGGHAYVNHVAELIDPFGIVPRERRISRSDLATKTLASSKHVLPTIGVNSTTIFVDDRMDVWDYRHNVFSVTPFTGQLDDDLLFIAEQLEIIYQEYYAEYDKRVNAVRQHLKQSETLPLQSVDRSSVELAQPTLAGKPMVDAPETSAIMLHMRREIMPNVKIFIVSNHPQDLDLNADTPYINDEETQFFSHMTRLLVRLGGSEVDRSEDATHFVFYSTFTKVPEYMLALENCVYGEWIIDCYNQWHCLPLDRYMVPRK